MYMYVYNMLIHRNILRIHTMYIYVHVLSIWAQEHLGTCFSTINSSNRRWLFIYSYLYTYCSYCACAQCGKPARGKSAVWRAEWWRRWLALGWLWGTGAPSPAAWHPLWAHSEQRSERERLEGICGWRREKGREKGRGRIKYAPTCTCTYMYM